MNDWLWHNVKTAAPQQVPWFEGKPVQPGETLISFRGDPWTYIETLRDPEPGRSAKLLMESQDGSGWQQQLNYNVFPGVEMGLPQMPGAPEDASSLTSDTPQQIDQMVNYAGVMGQMPEDPLPPTYRAIRAMDVQPGMRIRPPEGTWAVEIKSVEDVGYGQVKLDAGWGSLTLDRGELVDEEVYE